MSINTRRATVWAVSALAVAAAGATVLHFSNVHAPTSLSMQGVAPSTASMSAAAPGSDTLETRRDSYIIIFAESALASYKGETSGFAAPTVVTADAGRGRLDVRGQSAKRYVAHLEQVQIAREADLGRAIGRPLHTRMRMQHALNAIVVDLSPREAEKVAKQSGVRLLEKYREHSIDTDVGPRLIGAETVWLGQTPGFPSQYQGEGVVIGVIDTGINFGSPSFSAVGPVDGYQHVNPLGAGTYKGTCAPGGVDAGRCNDKLIGGYDFVCNEVPDPAQPAQTYCTQTASYREEPGFGDTNSHGSHTASTAGGNRRDVTFKSTPLRISGVAPHANIIAYDVCYTNITTGGGSCPNTSSVAAVNQAVADGIVNVINYSISGGNDPWSDAVSLAFLNAAEAGIYVATSAGNSGPGPNTVSHSEPWTSTTAAAQHGRADFAFQMSVTGPAPVPAPLQTIVLTEGTGGVSFSAALPGTTPLKVSAGIDTTNDGCAAFPANAFQGAIALVRRGSCSFAIKANNASAAGAIAVIIANNQAGIVSPSVPGTTVPVFSLTQAVANSLRDFGVANPSATAAIAYPPVAQPNTPDQLAAFSSRGPSGSYNLLKPDMTAPGVNILATIAGTTLTGSENVVGLLSGTSMASPHNAGAAALIHQAQPTWRPAEIKSALAMTAKTEVLLEDGVTQANVFARGSGRIRVDQAIRAGLILNETKVNYSAANPATGGNPITLNQPNMINGSCFERCSFTRTFRNTLSFRQAWVAKVEGLSVTISPALFTVNPGESKSVTFTVNSYAIPANGVFNFGTAVLTAQSAGNPNQPVLRLPIAVAVKPPVATLAPSTVNVSVPTNTSGTAAFAVGNTGGSRLSFSVDNTGTATVNISSSLPTTAGSGYRSTRYTDTTSPQGQYASDDFTLTASTRLTALVADGFVVSGLTLPAVSTQLTWSVYADNSGVPAGNPETGPAPVWSFAASPTGTGVTTTNGTIALNLVSAGQNVTLPAGHYWLVVNARTAFANRWIWFASDTGSGSPLAVVTPTTSSTWTSVTAFPGLSAMIDGSVPCGASWIGAATPTSGQVNPAGSTSVQVQINATGLAPGAYSGYACVATNDPLKPKAAVRIALTVTP